MKKQSMQLLAIIFLAVQSACSLVPSEATTLEAAAPVAKPERSVAEVIGGYRQWTRVNPVPEFVESKLAIQCAAPTAKRIELEQSNPHNGRYITVYVNEPGKKTMMRDR